MDFTKIIIAAAGSGVIGDAMLLAAALFFVLGRALRPACIRERRRGKVVRQIQRSTKNGEFTERQEKLLRALLEVPLTDDADTPGKDQKPPPAGRWSGWSRRR